MAEWFVRPNTAHGSTRNGTSYETAWGGWSEIVWGGAGVVGGDTLYVCGAHSYSVVIAVGAHGGSSEATRCTIRGDYPADPGSITFTANGAFLQNARAWTRITGLTFNAATTGAANNNCLFLIDAATNCKYDHNKLVGGTTAACISFYAVDGQDHSDIEIADNDISHGGGDIGGAISWAPYVAGAASTMTRLSILRNFIHDIRYTNNQVVHLRWEDDTNSANKLVDLVIDGNTVENCTGVALRIGGDYNTVGVSTGLSIRGNVFRNCGLSPSVLGGAIFVRGFAPGAAGKRIQENEAYDVTGAGGFVDLLYCRELQVDDNYCDGIYTTTIDGNGVLFDLGCVGCRANSNTMKNMPGAAAVNSGVGIMFLEGTKNTACGNVVIGAKWGVHIGAPGAAFSGAAHNNALIGLVDGGVYASATADLANCAAKNNVFVGTGYSVRDMTSVNWTSENNNIFFGFSSGASNHTLGANSKTVDPRLDADFRPLEGSPCIGAGVYIPGVRYMNGQPPNSPADIGPFPYKKDRRVTMFRP